MTKTKIARDADIAELGILKFPFTYRGRPAEGFLARYQGKLVAYENQCCHLPMHLDYESGRFFNTEGTHFVCQTHGAVYEPLTGLCTRGPCEHQSLKPLKIEIIDGDIWLIS